MVTERALDREAEYICQMRRIQQGLVNLFAAGLYHALEQQLAILYRRELTWPQETKDHRVATDPCAVTAARLLVGGVDIAEMAEWQVIQTELRLAANTVKHGDGHSFGKLQQRRPDLFSDPAIEGSPLAGRPRAPVLPLIGDGLYVQPEQLRAYADAIIGFLAKLASAFDEGELGRREL